MIPVPVLSHRRIAALGGAAAAAVCLPVLVLLVIVAGPPPAPEAAATSVPGANVPRGGGSTRAVGGITVAAELPHLYAVEKGVDEHDKIVVDGLRKVRDGATIGVDYKEPPEVLSHLDVPAE